MIFDYLDLKTFTCTTVFTCTSVEIAGSGTHMRTCFG